MIKYGGNAMINESLKKEILENVGKLISIGNRVVMVHGGGPFINGILDTVNLTSEFIGGHRKTSPEAMKYIEMALLGEVNSGLVARMNGLGIKAVGLSGKDGGLVEVEKRYHLDGEERVDLGRVGDVSAVNPLLLEDLLEKGYLPIVACIAADEDGNSFNINADMMAGAIAGALQADLFCVLTDVDGLRKEKDDPESLIPRLTSGEAGDLMNTVIVGGMIPKIESCQIALKKGAMRAQILNGTKPQMLLDAVIEQKNIGTVLEK